MSTARGAFGSPSTAEHHGRPSSLPVASSAIITALPAQPVLDVKTAMQIAGTSDEAARLALHALEKTGVLKSLKLARGRLAWEAIGHAVAAYEIALTYTKERTQFSKPLASFQIIQNKLAAMLANVTTMQLLCLRLSQLEAEGKMTAAMASLAKMNNARLAREVVADAREMLGGNGILLEYHIARHHADIEAVFTYEGTDTIQSLIVGRELTGMQAFSHR